MEREERGMRRGEAEMQKQREMRNEKQRIEKEGEEELILTKMEMQFKEGDQSV